MTRILVAGELNADLIMTGLPSLPILGRELVGNDFQMVMGSSSAITAARLARLGADVSFIGIVGDDDIGAFVVQQLRSFGVDTSHVDAVAQRTGVTIALTYAQDRALLTFPGTIETYAGHNITRELLFGYSHLHVGSFFLQRALQPELATIFQLAHEVGVTTSLDVGWDPQEAWGKNRYLYPTLQHVDFFVPNEDETTAIMGDDPSPAELVQYKNGIVIIKQGKSGATAYNKQGEHFSISSVTVDVKDTTGAGDAFNAGFIYAHRCEGLPIKQAMQFAAACGAQAVMSIGGASNAPSADMIRNMMNTSND